LGEQKRFGTKLKYYLSSIINQDKFVMAAKEKRKACIQNLVVSGFIIDLPFNGVS